MTNLERLMVTVFPVERFDIIDGRFRARACPHYRVGFREIEAGR